MKHIVTPLQMGAVEERFAQAGNRLYTLMERAAQHLCAMAWEMAQGEEALFLCGPGNNGGDGLAAARLYHQRGGRARVVTVGMQSAGTGDAYVNLQKLRGLVPIERDYESISPSLIVDALFGTGLTRAPQGEFLRAIEWVAAQGVPVLSADIPSGVDARDGSIPGAAVRADKTAVFHAYKTGNVFFPGRGLCGDMRVCDIGIDPTLDPGDALQTLTREDIPTLLPARTMDAHKGMFGHAVLVAGSLGMAGAAALCTRGALHMGAGLVSVACCRQSVLPIVQTLAPEAVCIPLPEEDGALSPDCAQILARRLAGKQAAAIGPGLSVCPGGRAALQACLEAKVALVIDADALTLLSQDPQDFHGREHPVILTPHPGEMARLIGHFPSDPLKDAREYAQKSGAVVLLKGASTVIATPDGRASVNLSGTPAMARGGSGDVLTGFIAALLAQGLSAYDAARLGAYLHGCAGEQAENARGTAMTAMDIPAQLGNVLRG